MKTIFTALLVLVAAGSYFYVHFKSAEAPDATVSPKVTDVKETDGSLPTVPSAAPQIAVFENKEFNFGFKFRIKPYGYS